MKKDTIESYFATVRKANAEGVKEITLDKSICNYLGLKVGDKVKVWLKKV